MYCLFCRHPLVVPMLQPNQYSQQVACTTCRAVFRVTQTVLHEPELSAADIKARLNVSDHSKRPSTSSTTAAIPTVFTSSTVAVPPDAPGVRKLP